MAAMTWAVDHAAKAASVAVFVAAVEFFCRRRRLIPTGFVPFAFASSLFVTAGALHQIDQWRGVTPRHRTHLHEATFKRESLASR